MITLFHRPKTRSSRVIFLLEELEAPYQIKLVTTRTRDGAGAMDPANPHSPTMLRLTKVNDRMTA